MRVSALALDSFRSTDVYMLANRINHIDTLIYDVLLNLCLDFEFLYSWMHVHGGMQLSALDMTCLHHLLCYPAGSWLLCDIMTSLHVDDGKNCQQL